MGFFNCNLELLFPKKIMQSQSGSITFRRVVFSICDHWLLAVSNLNSTIITGSDRGVGLDMR